MDHNDKMDGSVEFACDEATKNMRLNASLAQKGELALLRKDLTFTHAAQKKIMESKEKYVIFGYYYGPQERSPFNPQPKETPSPPSLLDLTSAEHCLRASERCNNGAVMIQKNTTIDTYYVYNRMLLRIYVADSIEDLKTWAKDHNIYLEAPLWMPGDFDGR